MRFASKYDINSVQVGAFRYMTTTWNQPNCTHTLYATALSGNSFPRKINIRSLIFLYFLNKVTFGSKTSEHEFYLRYDNIFHWFCFHACLKVIWIISVERILNKFPSKYRFLRTKTHSTNKRNTKSAHRSKSSRICIKKIHPTISIFFFIFTFLSPKPVQRESIFSYS